VADAVICIQCGLNLKTGKKVVAATTTASRFASADAKAAKGKLIKNVLLVLLAAGIFAFAGPRLWHTIVGEPRPQYARPAPQPTPTPATPAAGQPQPPPVMAPGMPAGMPLPPGMMMPPGAPGMTSPPVAQRPPETSPPAPAAPVPPPPGLMMPPLPPGQTGAVAMMPGYPFPPGMPLPPGMTAAPPAATRPVETNVVADLTPPAPPPKPPPPLLTAEDLQKLGPLEKLTVEGTTYQNVRWTRVSPREAFFFHSGGAASVSIPKLLPALKEQYHFEPPKHE
jgi:hypothetical protein